MVRAGGWPGSSSGDPTSKVVWDRPAAARLARRTAPAILSASAREREGNKHQLVDPPLEFGDGRLGNGDADLAQGRFKLIPEIALAHLVELVLRVDDDAPDPSSST